jgi:hypothetical protein
MKAQRTLILSALLYGCEKLSLTSSEKHKLRVSENRVLEEEYWA